MIIGISGKAGSGKDTAADVLVRDHGFVRIALADPMKRFARGLWHFTEAQLWGPSQQRNAPDPRYRRDDGTFLSPRHALQTLGTEWGRECDPDVWIRYALMCAERVMSCAILHYVPDLGLVYGNEKPRPRGVVIPDVRFANEMKAIRLAGGQVWRVTRGTSLGGAESRHVSETGQDSIHDDAFDRLLHNDGPLEALPGLVGAALLPEAAE
ncbi:MAG: hypothetical protein AMXMBFR56_77130 [Polyangiaceae bacterium]